jgi:hypothetical protein
MRGTFEDLRAAHRGEWLLIRTDGKEAQTGTLLFADKDSNTTLDLDEERVLFRPRIADRERPPY